MMNRLSLLKGIDSTVGAFLCKTLGNVNFLIKPDITPAPIKPETIRRILLIRPGGMGDMILLVPVLKMLREKIPDAEIDIVCEKRNLEVLSLIGMRENAIAYDSSPFKLLHQLKKRRYDVVIDTEQFHHFSAIFGLLSGAPCRIGFKINPRRNPLYTHLISYDPDGFEGLQFMNLLSPLGISVIPYNLQHAFAGLPLETPPQHINDFDTKDRPLVVIHPGASTRLKQWDPKKFLQLTRQLAERFNADIACLGNKNERGIAASITENIPQTGPSRIKSYAGKLDLPATACLLKHASLFVGSDSGLAHLAIALDIPTVIIFGPTDHIKWGLQNARHLIVKKQIPCSPCFIFGYHKPCRAMACMNEISVEDVMVQCEKVMP